MIDNYEILPNGVIHQKTVNKLKEYDVDYVDERYNSYGEKGMQMAYLRLGYVVGAICDTIHSILDVGYGNGDFLRACNGVENVYGNDISEYPLPDGVTFVEDILKDEYDVITFFDSLEHFEDISFVKDLKAKYIVVSLPMCHNTSDEWFENWKHRRPDEHLWHFNDQSLWNFMVECGYEYVNMFNVEDTIRKPSDNEINILTGVFKKK